MPAGILTPPTGLTVDLVLPDVTLLAVTSVALEATILALRKSQRGIRFADTLLLSDRPAANMDGIGWRRIAPLRSRADYSRFMLTKLHAHVETSHALCVQWDGYVVAPERWEPVFLEFDYIGAPWPHFEDRRVGNGGFSLRSRRLLVACAELGISGDVEDVAICRDHRLPLERDFGIAFAPEDIASRFAWERIPRRGGEFGFHGAFNLVRLISEADSVSLFGALDAGLLSGGEHRELLRWALSRGHFRLARLLWRRLRRRMSRG